VALHRTPTSSRETLLSLARPPSSPFRRTLKHQDNSPQSLFQPSHQTLCKAQNSTPHPPSRARHASPAQNRTSSTAWLRHSRAWPARHYPLHYLQNLWKTRLNSRVSEGPNLEWMARSLVCSLFSRAPVSAQSPALALYQRLGPASAQPVTDWPSSLRLVPLPPTGTGISSPAPHSRLSPSLLSD
jgi:hypothetical protein